MGTLWTLGIVIVLCILAEGVLRVSGTYRTWSEIQGGGYVSPTDSHHFYVPWVGRDNRIEAKYHIVQPEFEHVVTTNSLGMRADEPEGEKPAGIRRIIGLGDSFAMGYGVEREDSWLEVIERNLNSRMEESGSPVRYETVNAAVPGHDPVFSYQMLYRRAIRFEPDIVVLAVNDSDVFDLAIRGGMDRFDEQGRVTGVGDAPFEFLFQHSHLARSIIMLSPRTFGHRLHWNQLTDEEDRTAQQDMANAAASLAQLGKERGFHFLMVAHPHLYAVNGEKTTNSFGALQAELTTLGIHYFDLTPLFRRAAARDGIEVYFYPVDGHYTPAGQRLMGAGTDYALQRLKFVE
ncbi:MAG: hypothetical protein VX498_15775 [Myxococcota bacterium]|nr:hypothetical protein [Myxococcota bacterium]